MHVEGEEQDQGMVLEDVPQPNDLSCFACRREGTNVCNGGCGEMYCRTCVNPDGICRMCGGAFPPESELEARRMQRQERHQQRAEQYTDFLDTDLSNNEWTEEAEDDALRSQEPESCFDQLAALDPDESAMREHEDEQDKDEDPDSFIFCVIMSELSKVI